MFANITDPVGSSFVASLARPGGNITGLLLFGASIVGKWLAMLKEVAPHLARAALVVNPRTAPYDYFLRDAQAAAASLAIEFFFQIDIGTSYRSAIFYTSEEQKCVAEDTIADVDASGLWPGKVATEIAPAGDFWEAEAEHQVQILERDAPARFHSSPYQGAPQHWLDFHLGYAHRRLARHAAVIPIADHPPPFSPSCTAFATRWRPSLAADHHALSAAVRERRRHRLARL